MKIELNTSKVAAVSLVSIAIILISLNAGGGDLEPNAPPGSTMHTLDDIYNVVSSGIDPPAKPNAFDMFMKIESIPGESDSKNHKEWIEVLSYSHGITNSVELGPTRTGGRSEHDDISVFKEIDKASPKLSLFCCTGNSIGNVKLELCRTDGEQERFMLYDLQDVIVTSVRPSGSVEGGERPTEQVTLNYGKIEWTYTEFDDAGQSQGNVQTHWDVLSNIGD